MTGRPDFAVKQCCAAYLPIAFLMYMSVMKAE